MAGLSSLAEALWGPVKAGVKIVLHAGRGCGTLGA